MTPGTYIPSPRGSCIADDVNEIIDVMVEEGDLFAVMAALPLEVLKAKLHTLERQASNVNPLMP